MLDRVESLLDKGVTASEFLKEIDSLPLNTQAIADALYTITAVCLGTEQPRSELRAADSGHTIQLAAGNDDALRAALDSMLSTGHKLLLIQGAPGSGKSTLARKLCEWYNTAHFEADMFFERSGEYKFNKAQLPAAHAWCKEATARHYAESGAPCTIVSNVFSKPSYFKPYFDIAGGRENCIIIRLHTEHQNIHGAPDSIVEKMRAAIAADKTPVDIEIK